MLDWVKNIFSEKEAKEINALAQGSAAHTEVQGLNFTTAIENHLRWKTRLTHYIGGRANETLDADVVAMDDQCSLGEWINGAGGRNFSKEPGFIELIEAHARFHQCAADVVRKVHAGKQEEAEDMLNAGEYAKTSMLVIRLLSSLWNRLH